MEAGEIAGKLRKAWVSREIKVREGLGEFEDLSRECCEAGILYLDGGCSTLE